jgi:hypothetical protein
MPLAIAALVAASDSAKELSSPETAFKASDKLPSNPVISCLFLLISPSRDLTVESASLYFF